LIGLFLAYEKIACANKYVFYVNSYVLTNENCIFISCFFINYLDKLMKIHKSLFICLSCFA